VCLPIRCLETSSSIVACVFVSAGRCLPIHSVAMDVSSDFTIPTFGRHVTTRCNYIEDYNVNVLCVRGVAAIGRELNWRWIVGVIEMTSVYTARISPDKLYSKIFRSHCQYRYFGYHAP
jgi:hypothetical protein